MAVSKRLRYEVLRRDNHACRYCGATAPDVKLVIDHVLPETLGGKTEPGNLVTACEPCNSGKTSIAPSSPLVAEVQEDALRWSRAISVATEQMLAQHEAVEAGVVLFERRWNEEVGRAATLPSGWRDSVRRFIAAGLPLPILIASLDKAVANQKVERPAVFRYMCGIAWKRVAELHEAARQQVGGAAAATPASSELDDFAFELLKEGYESFPHLYRDACEAAAEDVDERDGDDRVYDAPTYDSTAARHLLGQFIGQLTVYEGVVDRALKGLSPDERAAIEQAVAHEYYKAGQEPAHETEHRVHLLRHMLLMSRGLVS